MAGNYYGSPDGSGLVCEECGQRVDYYNFGCNTKFGVLCEKCRQVAEFVEAMYEGNMNDDANGEAKPIVQCHCDKCCKARAAADCQCNKCSAAKATVASQCDKSNMVKKTGECQCDKCKAKAAAVCQCDKCKKARASANKACKKCCKAVSAANTARKKYSNARRIANCTCQKCYVARAIASNVHAVSDNTKPAAATCNCKRCMAKKPPANSADQKGHPDRIAPQGKCSYCCCCHTADKPQSDHQTAAVYPREPSDYHAPARWKIKTCTSLNEKPPSKSGNKTGTQTGKALFRLMVDALKKANDGSGATIEEIVRYLTENYKIPIDGKELTKFVRICVKRGTSLHLIKVDGDKYSLN